MKWELAWIDDTVRAWKKKNGSYICDYKEDDGVAYEFSHINMESEEIKEIDKAKISYYKKKEFYIPSGVLRFELNDDEALISLKTVEMLVELEKADKVTKEFLDAKNSELERQATFEKEYKEKKKKAQKDIEDLKNLLGFIQYRELEELREYEDIKDLESLIKYVGEVKSTLSSGKFKEIPKHVKVLRENRENRKEEYMEQIDKYVADKKLKEEKITIRSLTKDLGINRKTLYNLELNEYLKEVLNK